MKAIEYICNNLTRLNRPILEQLLAKENLDLTNQLWNYLQTTPWNTNVGLLKDIGLDISQTITEGLKIIYNKTVTTEAINGISWGEMLEDDFTESLTNYKKAYITFDGNDYICNRTEFSDNSYVIYGTVVSEDPEQLAAEDSFVDFPFTIDCSAYYSLSTPTAGEHTLIIGVKDEDYSPRIII